MLHIRKRLLLGAAATLLLTASACSSGGAPPSTDSGNGGAAQAPTGKSFTIAMITHEQPGSNFWDRVRAGAEQAAKQHGITLKYTNDPQASNQATLVQSAIDSKVDGLAVTLAAPEAVGPAMKKAADAGIPTVALNAGLDTYKKYGGLMYFGSDESLAGQAAGQRIAQEGGQKTLCIIHASGVVSLEQRCAGVKKTFPNTENLQVDGADLSGVTSTVQAKLAQDKSITNIMTLDAGVANATLQAKSAAGSSAKVATFDLNAEVVKGIQDKTIEFCVDQQPWLQGYEAVDTLWLNLSNGMDLGGGQPVLTGPSFVDGSNIAKIATYGDTR